MRALLIIVISALLFAGIGFAESPQLPGKQDRCPVCGMFVAPYQEWVSLVQFKDGTMAYFDGPKDMFSYLFDLGKFRPGTTLDNVSGAYVTEYYSTSLISAEQAFFVLGSDVLGPMGQELVPIGSLEDARAFASDHNGKRIKRYIDGKLIDVPDDE